MKKFKKKIQKNKLNKSVLAVLAIALVLVLFFLVNINFPKEKLEEITNLNECVKEGNVVIDSYPRQCRTLQGELFVEKLTLEESCKNLYGGKWLSEKNECENIGKDQCDFLGGNFNECASACRHNPSVEFCILVCVSVCKL